MDGYDVGGSCTFLFEPDRRLLIHVSAFSVHLQSHARTLVFVVLFCLLWCGGLWSVSVCSVCCLCRVLLFLFPGLGMFLLISDSQSLIY